MMSPWNYVSGYPAGSFATSVVREIMQLASGEADIAE
ncbi:Uncharacterised protein [Serratia fonticola]|uniref:Uncharacterized protein n=1 Tax=Serratia fonticola TaxID=47917 RepID=A0A4U9WGS3_SERFO|nr:Uncharacterised protein [Serratia fonticola]